MEFIRKRIERQVFSLTGLALNTIDYENPKGDPGLFGPDSIVWKVHSHFPSMLCGGISALLLQMLHPLALAGVWDHSNFRNDMIGRLRRTSQFIAGTSFASTADAQALIDCINRVHSQVEGVAPDGRCYRANDPELLRWVHVAEVSSFIRAFQSYSRIPLTAEEVDRYYTEVALIARSLGADWVPESRVEVDLYLSSMKDELNFDQRTQAVLDAVINAPSPSRMTEPVRRLMTSAAINLLPDWAIMKMQSRPSAWNRAVTRSGMTVMTRVLTWAIKNGASSRARRRLGA